MVGVLSHWEQEVEGDETKVSDAPVAFQGQAVVLVLYPHPVGNAYRDGKFGFGWGVGVFVPRQ